MSQKVEETLNRIKTHKGVKGVIIVNLKGVAIRSTMDQESTINYGSLINQFTTNSQRAIKMMHPEEDVMFIRIRSTMYEIMIAPDKEFQLIVIQDPSNDGSNDDAGALMGAK